MRCPACGHQKTKIYESRGSADKTTRRHECRACGNRFKTVEQIVEHSTETHDFLSEQREKLLDDLDRLRKQKFTLQAIAPMLGLTHNEEGYCVRLLLKRQRGEPLPSPQIKESSS